MAIETALIIEDEPHVQKFLVESLKQKNYSVTIAKNKESGICSIRDKHFDLILCDITITATLGTDVLKAAKQKDPDTRHPSHDLTVPAKASSSRR